MVRALASGVAHTALHKYHTSSCTFFPCAFKGHTDLGARLALVLVECDLHIYTFFVDILTKYVLNLTK